MLWLAGSAQHGVHTEIHVRHHIAQKYHLHELTGVGQCHIRGTEEQQDWVEEQQTDHHEYESNQQIERHRITQQMFRRLIVLLTKLH